MIETSTLPKINLYDVAEVAHFGHLPKKLGEMSLSDFCDKYLNGEPYAIYNIYQFSKRTADFISLAVIPFLRKNKLFKQSINDYADYATVVRPRLGEDTFTKDRKGNKFRTETFGKLTVDEVRQYYFNDDGSFALDAEKVNFKTQQDNMLKIYNYLRHCEDVNHGQLLAIKNNLIVIGVLTAMPNDEQHCDEDEKV